MNSDKKIGNQDEGFGTIKPLRKKFHANKELSDEKNKSKKQ